MKTIRETLLENRKIDESTGCWLWTGRLNENGYGVISLPHNNGLRCRDYLVHRIAFEEFMYPLKELCLHKINCPNQNCVNPEHLYEGTHKDNMKDSLTTKVHRNQYGNTSKTHCKNGHELSGENLIITSEGRRRCRTCQHEYNKKNWRKYS